MGYGIRMDSGLEKKPQVRQMARQLGVNRYEVVGRLYAVWIAVEEAGEIVGDDLRVDDWTPDDIDDEVGLPGFASAMRDAGWLTAPDGVLILPGYIRHNGLTTKARKRKQRDRMQRWRARQDAKDDPASAPRSAPRGASRARHRDAQRSEAQRSAAVSPPDGRETAAAGAAAQPPGGQRPTPGGGLEAQRAIEAERQAADAAVREAMAALDVADLAARGDEIRAALRARAEAKDFAAEALLRRLNGCPPHADNEHWRRAFALHLTPAEPAGRTA